MTKEEETMTMSQKEHMWTYIEEGRTGHRRYKQLKRMKLVLHKGNNMGGGGVSMKLTGSKHQHKEREGSYEWAGYV